MLESLKNHPFPVEAYFDRSLVLTFAIPKNELEQIIPKNLVLDTFQDQWAFIAVAMVQTRGLRPKGFPKFLGNDFFLIGYRVFVRYTTTQGKNLRGLYILKSETDKKKMQFFGNIFTHYNYTTTDIQLTTTSTTEHIFSEKSKFHVFLDREAADVQLPKGSPFSSWKEARRFAGPLPFTFTCDITNKTVLVIEGVRQNWQPRPVHVQNYAFQFLDQMNLKGVVLANAFEVRNVPYSWKKGKI